MKTTQTESVLLSSLSNGLKNIGLSLPFILAVTWCIWTLPDMHICPPARGTTVMAIIYSRLL